jgi:serine-type D-Ala-D-Ala carboxypeptidase/endopeptidase (penicillin-binding protein 4)
MKTYTKILLLSCLIILCSCSILNKKETAKAASELNLKCSIMDVLASPDTSNAFWGVHIKRIKDDTPFLIVNDARNFMPASNMKLYSTAVSLELFGKNHRFTTDIYHSGNIKNGVLNGDLIIEGHGDPAISGRYRKNITTDEILSGWVDVLKEKGIKSITGNIIGDDDYFADKELSGTWQHSNLSYWYTAPSSALSINDNLYQCYFYPNDKPGKKAIMKDLNTSYVQVVNEVITGEPEDKLDISFKRDLEGNTVLAWGISPQNGERDRLRGCVYNATLYAATLVKEALEKGGIKVAGKAGDIDEYSSEEKKDMRKNGKKNFLLTHESPAIGEIIRIINKPSQNYYADMLLKNLGKTYDEEGSFNGGEKVVKLFFENAGIPGKDAFQMMDGSGLSRKNLVQPRQTASLLEYMTKSRFFSTYYESLPIAGVDGTIKRRMKEEPAKGNVHAKTGFIGHARALSGYVDDRNGDRWVFSMMCNHYTIATRKIDNKIDQVCNLLANYKEDGIKPAKTKSPEKKR